MWPIPVAIEVKGSRVLLRKLFCDSHLYADNYLDSL